MSKLTICTVKRNESNFILKQKSEHTIELSKFVEKIHKIVYLVKMSDLLWLYLKRKAMYILPPEHLMIMTVQLYKETATYISSHLSHREKLWIYFSQLIQLANAWKTRICVTIVTTLVTLEIQPLKDLLSYYISFQQTLLNFIKIW